MVPNKAWFAMNFSLSLVALILLLNLFGVQIPSLGYAFYALDKAEPACYVGWHNGFEEINYLEHCCLEARKQLNCESEENQIDGNEVNWLCKTGPDSLQYWLNNKAYYYCSELPFWR